MKNAVSLLIGLIAGLCISFTHINQVVESKEILIRDTIQILVPTSMEVYLLAKMIESEASRSTNGIERITGRILAGETAINRLEDAIRKGGSRTLWSVLNQKKQFDGIRTSRFKEAPSKESLIAATIAALGIEFLPDNIMFFNTSDAPNVWNRIALREWCHVAQHSFKYKPEKQVKKTKKSKKAKSRKRGKGSKKNCSP